MPKLLFARPLAHQEKMTLERYMSSDNELMKQRALVVLLSSTEGYRVPEIAPIVNMHVDKVRKWVLRFNMQGLPGLQPARRRPGPRGKFNADLRTTIVTLAQTPPRELGLHRTTWTLDSLRDHLINQRYVTEISRESLRQILIENGIDWQSYRTANTNVNRWLQQWQTQAVS